MKRPVLRNICRVCRRCATHLNINILNIPNPSDLVFYVNIIPHEAPDATQHLPRLPAVHHTPIQKSLNIPNASDLVFYVNLVPHEAPGAAQHLPRPLVARHTPIQKYFEHP
jgi:hypothetical protein